MLRLLLRVSGCSLLLFLARDLVAGVYGFILLGSCYLIGIRFDVGTPIYDSSLRTIPFLALMLATPGITIKRRGGLIAAGVAAFLLLDLASILLWGTPPSRSESGTSAHLLYSMVWELSGHWILPFAIWFLAARRELQGIFRDLKQGPADATL